MEPSVIKPVDIFSIKVGRIVKPKLPREPIKNTTKSRRARKILNASEYAYLEAEYQRSAHWPRELQF